MEIYELTDLQYKVLKGSVSASKDEDTGHIIGETGAIFIPELNPVGTLEERKTALEQLGQMVALEELGLMENVTESKKESIDRFREQYGFGLVFFRATYMACRMFERPSLVVN